MTALRRDSSLGHPRGFDRRSCLKILSSTALGVSFGGLGACYDAAWAAALKQQKRQVLLLWLAGGASQMETWDPKPGHVNGGPFVAIPTATPGVHISELLPKTARWMDRVAVVRSLDTKIADHGNAALLMDTGRIREPGVIFPDWGTIMSKELATAGSDIPDYVSLYLATEGHRRPNPGFLGGSYSAMHLSKALRPENIDLPEGLDPAEHAEREQLRQLLSQRFDRLRQAPEIKGYNSTFARVRGLMRSDVLFDLEQEPQAVRDRYGPTDFGQHALVGRRLIEAGVPMVKVARAWWDSHADNFESHRELVTEFDHVYTTLLADLEERGLLDHTLVVVLSEFGRTPRINQNVGRDHFASAWSFALAGCGIRGGTVHGRTSDDGQTAAEDPVSAGDALATIYQAVRIDPAKHYQAGPRPVPLAPDYSTAVSTVLA